MAAPCLSRGILAQRLQVEQQVSHALIALVPILAQRLADDPLKLRGNIRVKSRQWRGLPVEDGRDDVAAGLARERRSPRDHLVEHHPQRPDVGPLVHLAATDLLGRHVGHRSQHGARVGVRHRAGRVRRVARRRGHQFRKPEVQHFDQAVGPAHHVLGLEIAVHDTGGMCCAHGRGDLDDDVEGLAHREVPHQPMAQRLAIDVLHRDELLAVRPLTQRVDRADVRMIERRERARLAREAGAAPGVGGEVQRQDLDGDVATELGVVCAVDLAHAPFAQLAEDAERSKRLTDHRLADGGAPEGDGGRHLEEWRDPA